MHSPPAIPDHVLLRPIGRGAYGEVWLARNIMGTLRAVKLIWRDQFDSERPFEREFGGIQRYEPVSRSSGGLVHVLHVGRNDAEGYFYYVMELADAVSPEHPKSDIQEPKPPEHPKSDIQEPKDFRNPIAEPAPEKPEIRPSGFGLPSALGFRASELYQPRTLRSDLKRRGRLSTAECLRLAIDVASGLGQLHRHGLVHRDVKPGNIIFVNGRAKLADIGLVSTGGEGRTFVGTEGYIPPEGPGSPGADLFALGVVLYEASTGFLPEHLPDAPPEWLTQPGGEEALELHDVILKACEGQHQRRYSDVASLQADLALLQSGQSLRRVRALERRYARLRLSGIIGTALLVVAVAAALFANYRARVAAENRAKETALREHAQLSQARAERAEREARRQLQAALYEQARALVLTKELGHRARALEALRQASGSTNTAELRRVAFAALGLPDMRFERELPLPGSLQLSQLDPRQERVAVCASEGPIEILSIPRLQLLATLPATSKNEAFFARWSEDGRYLAVKRQYDSTGSRSDLEVWDVAQAQLLFIASRDMPYAAFSFHPILPRLMVGHAGGAVSLWDLVRTQEVSRFQLPDTPTAIAYRPDGVRFAASYARQDRWCLAFHDAATGALLRAVDCPEAAFAIAWHPAGQWISITGGDADAWTRGVRLIPADSDAMILLGRHKIKTATVAFSPDGNYLMSCGWEREMFCWDLQNQQRVFTFANAGYAFDWSLDGLHCATTPKGHGIQFYAFERPACLELSGNRGERLRPGTFSPDGHYLALADSKNLCVWDLNRKGSPPALLIGLDPPLMPFFSPDNSQLFVIGGLMGEASLKGWTLQRPSQPAGPPELLPLSLAAPPSLNWAALAGDDLLLTSGEGVRFISRTNLTPGQSRVVKIPSGSGTVSPDGRWLAVTYSFSPLVTVYRLPEVEEVARLRTGYFVASVWFAPKGDELTIINRGGVEQWDTSTWRLKRRQPGFPVSFSYVLYTPDGTGVWRVTNFRESGLYDRNTLEPVLPLPANVIPLAVSGDGRQLAVSVDDQRVQIWDLLELRSHLRALGLDW